MISLVLTYHIFACLWAALSNRWIPPYDWLNPDNANASPGYVESYFRSLHYSEMAGIASGEVGPTSQVELGLATGFIILGAMINANAFAIMSDFILRYQQQDIRFQDKYMSANTTMHSLGLDVPLRRLVRHYLASSASSQSAQ